MDRQVVLWSNIASDESVRSAETRSQAGFLTTGMGSLEIDALVGEGVDALVIAAATPVHAELLHIAADARVPAFCEKPIALDLESTDAVIEHVQKSGSFVQIGFQRRFDAGYRAARDAVLTGSLGDVQMVRLASHDPAPPPEAYVAASRGIWLDLAIHDFDIAPWVLARPVVEVFADGVAHAELRGQFALDHSFFVPQSALVLPDTSPFALFRDACSPPPLQQAI